MSVPHSNKECDKLVYVRSLGGERLDDGTRTRVPGQGVGRGVSSSNEGVCLVFGSFLSLCLERCLVLHPHRGEDHRLRTHPCGFLN